MQLRFPVGSATPRRRCTCHPNDLSPTELQIVASLAAGHQIKDIAARMSFTESTISTYIKHAREKLGARDRTHLVTLAFRDRLLAFTQDGHVVARKQGQQ